MKKWIINCLIFSCSSHSLTLPFLAYITFAMSTLYRLHDLIPCHLFSSPQTLAFPSLILLPKEWFLNLDRLIYSFFEKYTLDCHSLKNFVQNSGHSNHNFHNIISHSLSCLSVCIPMPSKYSSIYSDWKKSKLLIIFLSTF